MDASRRDLQQLLIQARSNIYIDRKVQEWLKNNNESGNLDFYTTKDFVESDFRIAFSCLLNSYRATDSSIEKFLNQRVTKKERFFIQESRRRQYDRKAIQSEKSKCTCEEADLKSVFSLSNLHWRGVTALHVAVYRNSLSVDKIVKLLLNWDQNQNVHQGAEGVSMASIPMACGSYPLHILTGQNLTINETLLETLLCADSTIPFRDDVNGDNPISLLWKNTLVSDERKG